MRDNLGLAETLHMDQNNSKQSRVWLPCLLIGGFVGAAVVFVVMNSSTPDRASQFIPFPDSIDRPAPGYVGIEACRECHAERVNEFCQTNHFRTSRPIDPSEWLSRTVEGDNTYRSRNTNCWFEMSMANDQLYQTAFTLNANDGSSVRRREQAEIVVGAGAVDEILFYWQDRHCFQLPIAYLNPIQAWGNSPGFKDGVADFSRPVLPRCLECHNTWFDYQAGTGNEYHIETAILGISCERCHGPGQKHVDHHRSMGDSSDEIDAAHIVSPYELTREQQIALCAHCHGNANIRTSPPFSWRPGDLVEDHYRVTTGGFPEDNHTANHVNYLSESSCFQNSQMTCVSCHDPHIQEDPKLVRSFEVSCGSCHKTDDCSKQATLPESVRGLCVNCHMPEKSVVNINFSLADDDFVPLIYRHEHRIGIYPEATSQTLMAWHQTQNNSQSLAEAERLKSQLIQEYLEQASQLEKETRFVAASAFLREALRLNPSEKTQAKLSEFKKVRRKINELRDGATLHLQEGRRGKAITSLQELLKLKPNETMAHGALGVAYAMDGQIDFAITQLTLMKQFDQTTAYPDATIGSIHLQNRSYAKSVAAYQAAIEKEPFNAAVRVAFARALMAAGESLRAEEQLKIAIEIDPTNGEAAENIVTLMRKRGAIPETIQFCGSTIPQTRRECRLLLFASLADALADTGRLDEAIFRLNEAIRLANDIAPKTVSQLEARLWEFEKMKLVK